MGLIASTVNSEALTCARCGTTIFLNEGDDCFHCQLLLREKCNSLGFSMPWHAMTCDDIREIFENKSVTACPPMFVSDKGEMVNAYRLPQGRLPVLEDGPAWLQEAALWSETGEMRMALSQAVPDAVTTTKLVILLADGLIEVSPGDWVVWLWNNGGIEFERYDDTGFTRRFARTDHQRP